MKRIILFLSALSLLLGLAACAGEVKRIEKDEPTGQNAAVTVGKEGSVEGYCFEVNGTTLTVDAEMAPVLAALGEAKKYRESPSCAFDGVDKVYTYDHFQLTTYPAADGDRIQTIWLMDDLVATAEGLRCGDSRTRAEEIYGAESDSVGSEYVYAKGGMKLKLIFENDKVASITYQSTIADEEA